MLRAPTSARILLCMNNIATTKLFTEINSALLAGKFSVARALFDELGRRNDNHDMLASAKSYGIPETIRQLIQDRIDLVNSKAA